MWCAPDAERVLLANKAALGCSKLDRALSVQIAGLAPPQDSRSTFVNVGANKGYEIAELLEVWAPHLNVTRHSWFKLITSHAARTRSGYLSYIAKGACNEGRAAPKKEAGWHKSLKRHGNAMRAQHSTLQHHERSEQPALSIHAFELHPKTAQLLRTLVNATGASALVRVVNMPVSDSSAPVPIPTQTLGRPAGTEGSQICATCSKRKV